MHENAARNLPESSDAYASLQYQSLHATKIDALKTQRQKQWLLGAKIAAKAGGAKHTTHKAMPVDVSHSDAVDTNDTRTHTHTHSEIHCGRWAGGKS